jgi:protein-disulfide isomerase
MPSANIYSAFHCNDSIVVLHQHGQDTPQTLTIFREPQRLATHDGKLIAFYTFSNEAVTLLDDPQHDAGAVLNAIALPLKKRSNAALSRYLKYLACAAGGALLASAMWYPSSPEEFVPVAFNPVTETTVPGAADSTPLARAAAAESQNMQRAMQDNRNALPASPSAALQRAPSEVRPDSSSVAPAVHAAPEAAPETAARLQMAEVLKRNADRGMFTITLSAGHERTLYAFLDPTCSVCRAMEPAIERLAQEYNVIVFPVSVVNDGGNAVEKIVPLLCQKDAAKRAAGWQALFRADAGMSVPGSSSAPVDPECGKAAEAAVAVNNLGFRQFGFEGTPWVLTDTGFRLSTGLLAEPAKIDLFLKTTDQMQPEQADRFLKTINTQE